MVLNVRRMAKQFLTYGLGNISQSALSFLLLPVYMGRFTLAEYGVISILLVVVQFSSMVASGGMMSALHRLYFSVDRGERRRLAGGAALWHICLGVAVGGILLGFSEPISIALFGTAHRVIETRLVGGYFLFHFALELPFNLLRLEERSGAYVSFSIVRFGVDFVLKIIFVIVLDRGVIGYLESGLIAAIVTLICTTISTRALVEMPTDLGCFGPMLRLGVPFIFSGLAIWSLTATDRMMLNFMVGQSATGLYAVGQKFSQIFNIVLFTPFSALLPAVVFRFAERHDVRATRRMVAKLMNALVILGSAVYLTITLGTRDLLFIFAEYFGAREEYVQSTYLIPVLALAPLCYFFAICAGYSLLISKRPEFTSLAGIVAAGLNCILNVVLIPRWGVYGAAAATSMAYAVYCGLSYFWAQRHYRVGYDVRAIFLTVVAMVSVGGVLWWPAVENHVIGVMVRAPVGVVLFAIILWVTPGVLSAEYKSVVRRSAKRVLVRLGRPA